MACTSRVVVFSMLAPWAFLVISGSQCVLAEKKNGSNWDDSFIDLPVFLHVQHTDESWHKIERKLRDAKRKDTRLTQTLIQCAQKSRRTVQQFFSSLNDKIIGIFYVHAMTKSPGTAQQHGCPHFVRRSAAQYNVLEDPDPMPYVELK